MKSLKSMVSLLCTAALLSGASASGAEIVNNWQLDDADDDGGAPQTLNGWTRDNWGQWYDYTDGNGDSIYSWGWWGNQSIWQNTGATFEADTVYTMKVRARDGDGNLYGIKLEIQDVTANWQLVADSEYAFTLDTFGDNAPWEEAVLTFDTATNPGVVGHTIGIAVRAITNASGQPQAWVHLDSVSLTPEPTSLALLSLAGLFCIRRR